VVELTNSRDGTPQPMTGRCSVEQGGARRRRPVRCHRRLLALVTPSYSTSSGDGSRFRFSHWKGKRRDGAGERSRRQQLLFFLVGFGIYKCNTVVCMALAGL